MEDKYFMQKATALRDAIHDAKMENKRLSFEDIDRIIYMTLKEIAKKQRYTCVDNVQKLYKNNVPVVSQILAAIHNS